MNKKLTVGIVIPARNEEQSISSCLRSVTHQTHKPDEIIVVDNNSTDHTFHIAKTFPGVTVLSEKKKGIVNTRDRGFNYVKSDIIMRTDADTQVPKNWVSKMLKHFNDNKTVAVTGSSKYGKNSIPQLTHSFFLGNYFFFSHYGLYGPNMAIRREVWDKVKEELCKNDKEIHEDLDLGIHASKFGKIVFDKNLIVQTSARRLKNPKSFFVDYVVMWGKTLTQHKDYIDLKIKSIPNLNK